MGAIKMGDVVKLVSAFESEMVAPTGLPFNVSDFAPHCVAVSEIR